MKALDTRREFLKAAARWTFLSAIILAGRVLLGRQGADPRTCPTASPCGRCAVFDNCRLPKARSARQNT